MTYQISLDTTREAITSLRGFVPRAQLCVIGTLCRGEEGDYFRTKMLEYAKRVYHMPQTYEQDGKGDEAVTYLHYFNSDSDWWITEKDMEAEQRQAFGYVNLGYGGEVGYVSLMEICDTASIELDLHWQPKTLREIKAA